MRRINLHSHSTASDGVKTPAELAQLYAREGVDIVALTDHDTISGQQAFKDACQLNGITCITGIELTANCSITPMNFFNVTSSIHMVALGFDLQLMEEQMALYDQFRKEVVLELVNTMNRDGWGIDQGELLNKKRVMKSDVADWLIHHGYAQNQDEAFTKIINTYPQRKTFSYSPKEVIDLVHRCQGHVFLAHPFDILEGRTKKHLTQQQVYELVKWLIPQGLDGIEAHYLRFTEDERTFLFDICDKFNLKYTIGTDYHGKRDNELLYAEINRLPDWLGEIL